MASDRKGIAVIKKSALDKKAYQEGFDEMYGIIVQLRNASIYEII